MYKEDNMSNYPKYLGNPIKDEPASARKIKDLQAWQGRVYLGYGDWNKNLGPVNVWYYQPDPCGFINEATLDDENAIDRYVVIGDDLYIPGTDPRESWDYGNFYRNCNDGEGWQKFRTIPNGVHNFDMEKYKGKLFAALGTDGTHKEYALQYSEDDGNTWTSAVDAVSYRFLNLFKMNGKLFAVAKDSTLYRFNCTESKFTVRDTRLAPDWPSDSYTVKRVTEVSDDVVLYIVNSSDVSSPSIYKLQPGEDGRKVPFFDGKNPCDIVAVNGRVYVLTEETSNTATVYTSTDLDNWTHVGSSFNCSGYSPKSLAIMGNYYYVGNTNGDMWADSL
jgi:hypothetical protein